MKPALKLNIFIGFPSYGGNGGISSEVPDIREWWVETVLQMKADPRVGEIYAKTLAETPITMVRNKFFTLAKAHEAHLFMCVDSDQSPNKHAGEPGFRAFWKEAFDFIYESYSKGQQRMVVAPYVGPAENIYVFRWRAKNNAGIDSSFSLEQYTREEAAIMSGIQEVAAGPTGLFLMDMRLLDLIEPSKLNKWQVLEQVQAGKMTIEEGIAALREGYCYYEWNSQYADQKGSTEDVVLTRDISLAGLETLGYNPLYCAWNSWIGHWKPKNHGKPERFGIEHVGASLRRAVLANQRTNEVCMDLDTLNVGDKEFDAMRKLAPAVMERRTGLTEFKANGHAPIGGVEPIDWSGATVRGLASGSCVTVEAPKPEIVERHWRPYRPAIDLVKSASTHCKLIVDIGPGSVPFPLAHEFVGRKDPACGDYDGREFTELDLECDRLPYTDKSVDFVYCRHVIEDLTNPTHLLSEMNRIAKAGYIETPSPAAEATKGVNAPDSAVKGRGYPHHRSACWVEKGVLHLIPKMPCWDSLDLPDMTSVLTAGGEYWNTHYLWQGELKYRILRNEIDYRIGVDETYTEQVTRAIAEGYATNKALFGGQNVQYMDQTTSTGRATYGPWFNHGHMPEAQQEFLKDIVRAKGYKLDRPVRILEVGSWLGSTAIAMADSTDYARVFCVDTWEGTPSDITGSSAKEAGGPDKVYEEFVKRVGTRLDKTIFPYRKSSAEAAAMHWEQFDVIFIDADHTYEAVKADILGWLPHLREDGVMIGHDFHVHGYDGVVQAVEEVFGDAIVEACGFHPQGCMWKVEKRDYTTRLCNYSEKDRLKEKANGQLATA